jgi:hypothetical protein
MSKLNIIQLTYPSGRLERHEFTRKDQKYKAMIADAETMMKDGFMKSIDVSEKEI